MSLLARFWLACAVFRCEPVAYTLTGGSGEEPSLVVTFVRADIARARRRLPW